MRIQHLFIALVLVTGCQPDPPGAGREGNPCRSWPAPHCDDGLTCKNDVCQKCGGPGEQCCAAGGQTYCDNGLACDGDWDENAVCQDDCGMPGLPCCAGGFGPYCPIGSCNQFTDQCEGDAPAPCLHGSTPYSVAVLNANCVGEEVVFYVDSEAEAEQCRQDLIATLGPEVEVCKLGQAPTDSMVCQYSINGTDQLFFLNCSQAQLERCEENHCFDCTWTDGQCPE